MTLKEFLELSEQRFPPAQEKGWTIVRRDGKVETPPHPTFKTKDDAQKTLNDKNVRQSS